MIKPVCVIVGAGPGNGAAFARRFAGEGYRVGLLARSQATLGQLEEEIEGSKAYAYDAVSEEAAHQVFAQIKEDLGPVEVLIYNASTRDFADIDNTSAGDFERAWRVTAYGCFLAAKQVVSDMRRARRGSIVIIGATASLKGTAGFVAFAAAKAAQRSLAQSIARDLGPDGIHVSHVVIDAVIDLPATRKMMPDKSDQFFAKSADIAETVFFLTQQPRSAWTFELDVRPFVEKW